MLTKSDLLSFLQCPRKLWLEHHRRDLIPRDDFGLYRRIRDGLIVGEKAREQLGDDYLWPPGNPLKTAAAEAARAMLAQSPNQSAAEVPMVHDGLYARADALIPEGGAYVLRETKASTFKFKNDNITPAAPEEHLLNDVAIQIWAMEGWGLPLARAELNLLNSAWCYPGNGDYSGLFRQLDVTPEAQTRKNQMPRWVDQSRTVLAGEMPQIVTGKQCSDPFPCPFIEYCEPLDPPAPEHPIELLPGQAGKSLAQELRRSKGYTSILDAKPEELAGEESALYRRIQTAHRTGEAVLEPGSVDALGKLPYPRYYFDFECIDLPVPRWKGVRPYEHVPFQWSCHIESSPGVFEYAEFLDLTGNDPSLPCIERIQETISPEDGGPIIVYFMAYEKLRLQELGMRHPQYAPLLQRYIGRLFDLLPVVQQNFYHPRMEGSFSIKKVLPAVAPDLNYKDLEEVREGTGAQVAYLYAAIDPNTATERKRDLENKLRRYCRQDTWAMVELAYFLSRSGRPKRPDDMKL